MELLYSAAAIQGRVDDIASSLNRAHKGQPLVHAIVMMNGAMMFAADVVRKLNLPLTLHFCGGSYFDGAIKHEVGLNPQTLPSSFNNAPVLIIEDIVDSGKSVATMRQLLADRHASEIKLVTLLKRQSTKVTPDECAFTIPDNLFVVGYGMDLDGRYRELKDIRKLATGTGSGVC
ncbi:MAG: phosphoribosyltransferase family protein [Alphaproteobacteria bacterium]